MTNVGNQSRRAVVADPFHWAVGRRVALEFVYIISRSQYYERGYTDLNYPLLHKLELLRYTRNPTEMHQLLYGKRLAVPLGKTIIRDGRQLENELQQVVGRVRAVINAELPQ